MKPIRFGIIGEYQSGKSLLINCILHRPIATIGVGNATTHTIVNYFYSTKEHVVYHSDNGIHRVLPIEMLRDLDTKSDISEIDVYLSSEILKNFILTDMPGFGANEEDNIVARKTLREIDFAILLAWNNKVMGANSQSFYEITLLKALNIPYYFFLNCTYTDRWRCDDEDNISIAQSNLALLDFYKPSCYPLEGNGVYIVNLMWYWYSICGDNDELIKRRKNLAAFKEYEINFQVKGEVGKASNFELINKLFDMENILYLELRREIRSEIKRLKEEVCPIGSIQAFAYNTIPSGWLPCDGHLEPIEKYKELYDVIGITFGGDGKVNFCVPDLRGRFVRGFDPSRYIDKESEFGKKQEDAFQNHIHQFNTNNIKISEGGKHYHNLWCHEYDTVTSVSGLASTEKNKRMCYPGKHESGKTDLGPYAGEHSHEISIDENPISIPTQINESAIRIAEETRPKNIALLYCIKCI